MIRSSAPKFKSALQTRLEAIAGLGRGTTLISRGHPYPKGWAGHTIIIGQVLNRRRQWVAAMTQCNEEYDVEILISAGGSAQDPYSGFEDQAYALADAVEDSLISWTREGGGELVTGAWGQVLTAIPGEAGDQEGIEGEENRAPKSRESVVSLMVHVAARLINHG